MILRPALILGALLAISPLGAGEAANKANPGENLEISSVLAKGHTTIVDFYSAYCPPCMKLSPLLEQLGEKRPDLRIVKVDINRTGIKGIDWGSPLAKQFSLKSIPHFKIFDGNGKMLAEGEAAFKQVMTMLQEKNLL